MNELPHPIAMIAEALSYYESRGKLGTSYECRVWNELVTAIEEGYYYQDDRHLRIDFGD